ncbi:MAG TPA: dephospho-CoA kinase [Vicinamibacteria bacterium]|nr:dephospho-CoA kinase [Vicinamibacteria bacterium]
MLRLGLTGGIACGKSTVLKRFAAAGFGTVDLDRVTHELQRPGAPAHRPILEAFGPSVARADGSIDRKALGAIVFKDTAARERLNALLHPLVRQEESRHAEAHARKGGAVFVTDAALLVEAGVHLRFDRLVVVHCAPAEQLRRLQERDGLGEEEALARIGSQMPQAEKRAFAHAEIDSSGPVPDTIVRADALAKEFLASAQTPVPPIELAADRALGALAWGPASGPEGLSPLRLLQEIADRGGLEMEGVLRLLVPPREGPWYRAARKDSPGPGPETLVAPVVLFALSRRRPDPLVLLASAASLARLTHGPGPDATGACLVALMLLHVARTGTLGREVEEAWPAWVAAAARWGGGGLPGRLSDVLDRARERLLEAKAGPRDVPGGLAGMALGASPSSVAPPIREAVRRVFGDGSGVS